MMRPLVACVLLAVACGANPSQQDRAVTQDDAAAIREFYYSDVPGYWGRYGFPPLARLANINVATTELGPYTVFGTLAAAFDEESFANALHGDALAPTLTEYLNAALEEHNGETFKALVDAVRRRVADLDAYRLELNEIQAEAIYGELTALFNVAFVSEKIPFPESGPPAEKELVDEPGICLNQQPPAGDAPLNVDVPWERVNGLEWPEVKYPCQVKAIGLCASKLGVKGIGPNANCPTWAEIGKEVQEAEDGRPRATGTEAWFRKRNYCVESRVTKCDAAEAALERGCDVMLSTSGANGTHVAVVTELDCNFFGDGGTAHVNDWGRDCKLEFDDRIEDKRFVNEFTGDKNCSVTKGQFHMETICPCKKD